MAPVGASGTLLLVAVIPAGRGPRFTVPLPLTFTSEGCTVKEKLLPAKTVVGDGDAHNVNAGGLVAGYGKGSETIGPWSGFVTVTDRAPGLLIKPNGK